MSSYPSPSPNIRRCRRVLVLAGLGAILLWAGGRGEAIALERVTLFADFEHGLGEWRADGPAFGVSPNEGDRWGRRSAGKYFADSSCGGERATGVLRSPEFPCPDEIRFLTNGWDKRDGSGGRNFYRLLLRDGTIIAQSKPPLRSGPFVQMRWHVGEYKGQPVHIEVVDQAAEGSFAWLAIDQVELVDYGPKTPAEKSDLYGVGAGADAPLLYLPGASFLIWKGPPSYEGKSYAIPLGCRVRQLFLLGHISTYDYGCAHWGYHTDFLRDFSSQQMIGDRAGEIRLEYADGDVSSVPLIFGFTMWWDKPWGEFPEPIKSRLEARRAFETSCHLREVVLDNGEHRFVGVLKPKNKVLRRVVFVDSPAKRGCPLFMGLSVRTDQPASGLRRLEHSAYDEAWLQAQALGPQDVTPAAYSPALARLKSEIGMSDADLPASVPLYVPRGFKGPRMVLEGGVIGDILTNVYMHTVQSAARRSLRADGYIYCAPPNMPDYNPYNSIGTYRVDSRGAYSSWTRGYEYLRDLAAWGYRHRVTRAIDWMDSKLYYYPREAPLRFRWKGRLRPWPAHWATTADHPPASLKPGHNEIPGDENDGHAMAMMVRYAQWLATGRDVNWLRKRWKPAVDAAEWLCFVLDYTGQDVLYCESEGTGYGAGFDPGAKHPYDAYENYDIFTNTLGPLALRQYADMAEALGDMGHARRWRQYADRIEQGRLKRCVVEDPRYGRVWRVHPNSVWPQFDERLAPVFELPYYQGLDSAALMPEELQISRNSLRLQIGDPPDYAHGHGLGYGQAWVTSAALLLDEMRVARPLVTNLARYVYFPKHPLPFVPCEGVVVAEDGDFRVRMGTMGIDEALYITRVFRVLMGVDDHRPDCLVLMPRLPEGLDAVRVSDYPVTTWRTCGIARAKLSYTYRKSALGGELVVTATKPLARLRARLGPLAVSGGAVVVQVGGRRRVLPVTYSGDAAWVWVDLGRQVRATRCRVVGGAPLQPAGDRM